MTERPAAAWPAGFLRFVELFNAERYWDSHEALETPWRERRSGFYHGLILYASAFVHVRRGNAHGVDAQLRKADRALSPYRSHYMGLDVDALLEHGRRCRRVVARHGADAAADWPLRVPRITLEPRRALVHGDEPELESDG